MELLGRDELAKLIGVAPQTISTNLSRRPWDLPPYIKIGAKTFWRPETVDAWCKSKEVCHEEA